MNNHRATKYRAGQSAAGPPVPHGGNVPVTAALQVALGYGGTAFHAAADDSGMFQ